MKHIAHTLRSLLLVAAALSPAVALAQPADLVLVNGLVTTMNEAQPQAEAFAMRDGVFVAVGDVAGVREFIGPDTRVIDASGKRVIPGLIDSHTHAVRGGRFYNLELRWDGVLSLERGLDMIGVQAKRTPHGQWVRVIGGWSPYQFEERRMPTIDELNVAAPDTPVFVLFLYSQGFLNRAGVEALGLDEDSIPPAGGRYEFIDGGAILHAEPDPTILYKTIARLPGLSPADQVNSTMHFFRELSRFGLTSVIDAGGGGHLFPNDYGGSLALADQGELPIRISYYLFPQRPGAEFEDFTQWTREYGAGRNGDASHEHGFELEGAGEFLVWSAGDFENFMSNRPELSDRAQWRSQLHDVTELMVQEQWPLRIHATYGESIAQILDVFEAVKYEQDRFVPRWAIDHAETATRDELERIKALGGGVAIQNRMAFAGEFFVERYGVEAARNAPPLRAMLELDIPVGGGTDFSRVSSHNPWLSLHWMVTGETLGGATLFSEENKLSRAEALELYTIGSAWFSGEDDVKGRIAPGQFADFAVLNMDYFTVAPAQIRQIESELTVIAGEIVYTSGEFSDRFAPSALPSVSPAWSPVSVFGGYQSQSRSQDR